MRAPPKSERPHKNICYNIALSDFFPVTPLLYIMETGFALLSRLEVLLDKPSIRTVAVCENRHCLLTALSLEGARYQLQLGPVHI